MDEAITSYIKKKNRIFSYTEIEEINVKPENYINHELYYTRRQRLFPVFLNRIPQVAHAERMLIPRDIARYIGKPGGRQPVC